MKHICIAITFLSLHLNAQYEATNWFVTSNTILDFSITPAQVINTFTLPGQLIRTSVSDAAGNLKVIALGDRIYNSQGQLVAPQNSATAFQGGIPIVIPMPGDPSQYYVFVVGRTGFSAGNLTYSIFNPALAGGSGSLTVMNRTVNAYNSTRGICAIKHCNGKDVWVVCGQDSTVSLSSYKVYSYLLTASGINTVPVISSVNNLADPTTPGIMNLRSSPDGRLLAIGSRRYGYPQTYSVVISDFDRATGTLKNSFLARRIYHSVWGASKFEFSPDGSKLYTVEHPSAIVQLDLCAGSPTAVVASADTVATLPAASNYTFYQGIQRAINGNIYLSHWTATGPSNNLAAILQPNNAGSACSFSLHVQNIGAGAYNGHLPHYAHYLLKPLINISQSSQECSKVSFNGPSPVCSAVAGSLSSFYWDFGEPASPTNTSSVYSPTHRYGGPGSYRVKLVMDDGQCVADTLYQTVTVLPNPTLNINVSPTSEIICPGQTTTLTATGASAYTWMPGALSGSQVVVSPAASVNYTILGADSIGCGNTNSVSVSVYPAISLTISTHPGTVCAGDAVTLTANGAQSFTWNTGTASPTLTLALVNKTSVFTITAMDENSCTAQSTYTLNVNACTGIKDAGENPDLCVIHPNPARETLLVELKMAHKSKAQMAVHNSLGQNIYPVQLLSPQLHSNYQIDVRSWPRGLYFIIIVAGEEYAVRKLLLE